MPGRGRAIPARRDGFRPGRAPSCGDTFPRIRFPMLASTLNFLAGGLLQFGWGEMLLYLLVATQLTIFAVTLYLHRSQAHRGVDFHPAIAHFFRFWTWLTTSKITRAWVAIHRQQDRKSTRMK